jgi:hypothetical protein
MPKSAAGAGCGGRRTGAGAGGAGATSAPSNSGAAGVAVAVAVAAGGGLGAGVTVTTGVDARAEGCGRRGGGGRGGRRRRPGGSGGRAHRTDAAVRDGGVRSRGGGRRADVLDRRGPAAHQRGRGGDDRSRLAGRHRLDGRMGASRALAEPAGDGLERPADQPAGRRQREQPGRHERPDHRFGGVERLERRTAVGAVAQVRAHRHEVVGRGLAVDDRRQHPLVAGARLAGLDAGEARQEPRAPLRQRAVDLRVAPAALGRDLRVRRAGRAQQHRARLVRTARLQRLGRLGHPLQRRRSLLDVARLTGRLLVPLHRLGRHDAQPRRAQAHRLVLADGPQPRTGRGRRDPLTPLEVDDQRPLVRVGRVVVAQRVPAREREERPCVLAHHLGHRIVSPHATWTARGARRGPPSPGGRPTPRAAVPCAARRHRRRGRPSAAASCRSRARSPCAPTARTAPASRGSSSAARR